MNCSRFETLITDFMEGQLDPLVRSAVEQHLHGCSACETLLAEVIAVRRQLAEFPEVGVREELVTSILVRTSGLPSQRRIWADWLLPTLRPFLTQRYAFATLMAFAFISFAVNVMGPGFSASSYTRLSPSALVARADVISSQIYKGWREFNDFKARIAEEAKLFREDLFGRLDYHLVTVLFRSYSDSLNTPAKTGSETDEVKAEDRNNHE